MKGALYLSLAAFIVKGLSALYKVPYQNFTGDHGFYVYQQVYPIYGIALVLGSYGIPVVIARIVSEGEADKPFNGNNGQRIFRMFLFLTALYSSVGICLFYFAEYIAILMGDRQLTRPIQWLALPFFTLPFLAVGRGYYQGKQMMLPTAFSQVGEQFVRVVMIIMVAAVAMQYSGDPYKAGISAGAGAFAGGLAGIAILGYYSKGIFSLNVLKKVTTIKYDQIGRDFRDLIVSGLFVSISAMAFIIYQLIDAFMVYRLLLNEVDGSSAAVLKGIYDRSWPLVQFGAVVTTVFSYAVLPFITKAYMTKKNNLVQQYIGQSLKVCLVYGGAAAIGLITLMPSINPMLYMNHDGQVSLQILATTVLFGSMFMTGAALLHAVYRSGAAFVVLLVGLVLKFMLNIVLIPEFEIRGAALASAGSFMIVAILLIMYMKKNHLFQGFNRLFWGKWMISLSIMAAFVLIVQFAVEQILLLNFQLPERLVYSMNAIFTSTAGGALFILVIWKLRVFDKNEWESLPKVSRYLPYQ